MFTCMYVCVCVRAHVRAYVHACQYAMPMHSHTIVLSHTRVCNHKDPVHRNTAGIISFLTDKSAY